MGFEVPQPPPPPPPDLLGGKVGGWVWGCVSLLFFVCSSLVCLCPPRHHPLEGRKNVKTIITLNKKTKKQKMHLNKNKYKMKEEY